ncbi:MAG: S41 family peptidase [Bacteroidales bacterium]|nr:S41 family peptidase [Bacteroidales bacterium]
MKNLKIAFFYILISTVACLQNVNCQESANCNLTNDQKVLGLSLIWKEAAYNFPYFDRLDIDWTSTYQNYIPKVIDSKSDLEYFLILQEFISQLKDEHTKILMPYQIENELKSKSALPVFDLVCLKDGVYVTAIKPVVSDTVPLGSEIIEINGQPIYTYLHNNFSFLLNSNFPQSKRRLFTSYFSVYNNTNIESLAIKTNDGLVKTINITNSNHDQYNYNSISSYYRKIYMPENTISSKYLDEDILYINIAGTMNYDVVSYFDSIYNEINSADGIIIDLRYNTGGTSIGADVACYFSVQDTIFQFVKTRVNNANMRALGAYTDTSFSHVVGSSRHFEYSDYYNDAAYVTDTFVTINNIPKNKRMLNKKIVVLVDSKVLSAAENFLMIFKDLELATFVGEPSGGSCSQPLLIKLPGGGIGFVATQKTYIGENNEFEYLVPDIEVYYSIEDFLNDKDPILEKGLIVLKGMLDNK